MLIEMKVAGLTIDPITEMPILILRDQNEESSLPVWIGLMEAASIASELEQIELSRPTSHDLLKTVLQELTVTMSHVEITEMREDTYYATICLEQGSKQVSIDARPSDAIALALRVGCSIRVDEEVVKAAEEMELRATGRPHFRPDSESAKEYLARLPEEDFGKWRM